MPESTKPYIPLGGRNYDTYGSFENRFHPTLGSMVDRNIGLTKPKVLRGLKLPGSRVMVIANLLDTVRGLHPGYWTQDLRSSDEASCFLDPIGGWGVSPNREI